MDYLEYQDIIWILLFIVLFLVQEESDAASSFSSMSAYKPMVGSKAFNSVSHTHTHVHIHTHIHLCVTNVLIMFTYNFFCR